jgi:hypothetical protein
LYGIETGSAGGRLPKPTKKTAAKKQPAKTATGKKTAVKRTTGRKAKSA